MSSLPHPQPESRPKLSKNKPLSNFPADELADFQYCTPEELGVLMRLRWIAWYHGGIENSETALLRLRKSLGVSPQKFKKLWPFLSTFFTETSGFLFFSADEPKRIESEERTSKLQEAGRKGGQNSWNARHSVPKKEISLASATLLSPSSPSENLSLELHLPAATYQQPAAAGDENKELQSLANAISDLDCEALALRAADLGLQAPDKPMAFKILSRFPKIPPDKFPLLSGQKSSALWLHKQPADLELEIRRQEAVLRKPPQMSKLDIVMEKVLNRGK